MNLFTIPISNSFLNSHTSSEFDLWTQLRIVEVYGTRLVLVVRIGTRSLAESRKYSSYLVCGITGDDSDAEYFMFV